jgi:pimeloyl-ACP methyl ester carboxylesterase
MAYAGATGGDYLVNAASTAGCQTPADQYGWSYEAINYDIADDSTLAERNDDLTACTDQGAKAGDEVVTDDGVRIAGWYIPAANGAGPTAPTIVLVHGFRTNKSGILHYAEGLHDEYNVVAFDLRNAGRSTGDRTTAGVLEQRDLRAVIDWLERTKHPDKIGLLGNSLGAATALAETVGDDRVDALVLDSMHTRLRYQIEARVQQEYHHPAYPATWAVLAGAWLKSGVDVSGADADDVIARYDRRPLLLIHGTADTQDEPRERRRSSTPPKPVAFRSSCAGVPIRDTTRRRACPRKSVGSTTAPGCGLLRTGLSAPSLDQALLARASLANRSQGSVGHAREGQPVMIQEACGRLASGRRDGGAAHEVVNDLARGGGGPAPARRLPRVP